MTKSEQIRQRLRQMAMEVGPKSTLLGTVKSVNETERTCVIYDDDLEIDFEDVRLRPVIDETESLTLVPKVNAWALAVRIEDEDDWMVIAAGEFEKVLLTCENVVFNGGNNGGLVNWPDAKAELDKTNQLLTALIGVINGAPIPEPGSGSPSALQTALQGALTGKTLGVFEGLEDEKVKH